MSSWINWGIVSLAVFVVLLSALYAAAPGFLRVNKGEPNEAVSVWLAVVWSLVFTIVIVGSVFAGLYFSGNKLAGFGAGCGCNAAWGMRRNSVRIPSGLEAWSQVG